MPFHYEQFSSEILSFKPDVNDFAWTRRQDDQWFRIQFMTFVAEPKSLEQVETHTRPDPLSTNSTESLSHWKTPTGDPKNDENIEAEGEVVVDKVHSSSTELIEYARPNSIYTGHDRNPFKTEPNGKGDYSNNISADRIPPIHSHSTWRILKYCQFLTGSHAV